MKTTLLAGVLTVAACGPGAGPSPSAECSQDAECDDGNPCTVDACSGGACASGGNTCPCVEDADCAAVDDGDLCNGTLVCDAGNGCVVDPATVVTCPTELDTACSASVCEPATGACVVMHAATGTACSDGDDCTGGDACEGGACRAARELCCDDGADNDGDELGDCDDADCGELAVCDDACPPLAPVEESPLPVESAASELESTAVDGFSDDYVYNAAGTIKLGTRRDWGGAIVFFGLDDGTPGTNATNAIDGADTGREVQIALYDVDRWYQNCAWDATCGATPSPTECPQQMTWLGWNPVQGGNRCNRGSGTDAVALAGGAITVTTTPLYWNPHWDRTDCNSDACRNPAVNTRRSDVEVTQRARFVRPNVVELSYRVTNLADVYHAASMHEFPTMYAAFGRGGTPDLRRLFDSSGLEIAIDDHPPADAAFRYKNFTSPGGWVTLQNAAADYGVGLYYENGLDWYQAWQADDPKFNNVRGLFSFAIPALGYVRARAYLILGSRDTVAAEAQWLDDHLPPFGSLDAPVADAALSGTVAVYGWALDNDGVSAVQLVIDGGAPIPLAYGGSRPDVCAVWPGYPRCPAASVGFNGSFDAGALAPSACGHVIEINAIDGKGNARVIARRRVYRAE